MFRLARVIATAGGAGYAPVAPGTCGTAVAVPIAWLAADLGILSFSGLTLLTIAVGIWAAGEADRSWGTHDSGRIVIDEVAGYFATVALVNRADLLTLAVGFAVFRAFDIVKPPPVRAIDRRVGGGAGVVLDDVAAGLLGCAVMVGLAYAGLLATPAWLVALRS
jgi:phosphatidylglycerophosphatase A